MTYPTNYLEQLLYVRQIQNRLSSIDQKLSKVTVRSFYPPTQQMWEDAYFEQTGNPPSIPVGVKLVWYNLQNCEARLYYTVYDENGGTTSSGTVYESVDNSYDRPAIRLIGRCTNTTGFGYANPNDGFIFGSVSSLGGTDETIMVKMDRTRWSKRNLVGMFLIYEVRATSNPMNLHFLFSSRGQLTVDGLPVEPSLASADVINDTTNWLLSGVVRQNLAGDSVAYFQNTAEQNSISMSTGGVVSDNTSPTNTFMSGVMWIGNVAMQYASGVHDTPKQNEIVLVEGQIQRGAFNVTNSLYVYDMYLARTDGLPAHAAPFFGMATATTTGAMGTGIQRTNMGNLHSESSAWLYGIFADSSNRTSEFDE